MITAEDSFYVTGDQIPGAIRSQMFGKPCFKTNGKAFLCFFQDCMVFKLDPSSVTEALTMEGARLFDPSGKNRPMKEWVQLPHKLQHMWSALALKSLEYIQSQK